MLAQKQIGRLLTLRTIKTKLAGGANALPALKGDKMAKAIEHGVRSPRESSASEKKEKQLAYGVRSVSSDFERRPCEANTPPSNANYRAKGAKFDSMDPKFSKFK